MSFLTRPAAMLRTAALRPALSAAPKAHQQIRCGSTDYGSGSGDPAAQKPEKQGANRSESVEHPGPAPPKVAKGQSSSSPNNQDSSNDSQKSPSSQSKSSSSNKGAKPKILDEKPPPKEEQSEEVKRHNKELEERTEKKHEQAEKK
jgi:hypothetical protein